jgi:hypothetical protein
MVYDLNFLKGSDFIPQKSKKGTIALKKIQNIIFLQKTIP